MGEIFRFPRSTLASKIKSNAPLKGREGLAAIKMVKLLAQAQRIVDNSTSEQAEGFDTAHWLGQWLEQAQPAEPTCETVAHRHRNPRVFGH